jgi:hypothetical protein
MLLSDLERALLLSIKAAGALQVGYFITDNATATRNQVKRLTGIECDAEWADVAEAFWALLARRMIYVGGARSFGGCSVWLTERGQTAVATEDYNPDDRNAYMRRLLASAPATSATVQQYLVEALKTYEQECYLASAVMLGAAAEETTLEVAASFVKWKGKEAENLATILNNPRQFYVYKLQEFEKRLKASKGEIPQELAENLELQITAVLQLVRLTRNDAGHPTGRRIDRTDCYQNLILYANTHQKLHRLKQYFENPTMNAYDPATRARC